MVKKPQALFHIHIVWISYSNKDIFSPQDCLIPQNTAHIFWQGSAAVKHLDNKQCSTTHQYLSLPSLDSELEEEISITDLDGVFLFYGQFITMRQSKKLKQ